MSMGKRIYSVQLKRFSKKKKIPIITQCIGTVTQIFSMQMDLESIITSIHIETTRIKTRESHHFKKCDIKRNDNEMKILRIFELLLMKDYLRDILKMFHYI